jgi:phage shock protein E
VSAARRSRLARLTTALGVAASLTFAVAGCASAPAPSSIELSADTVIVDVRTPDEFASGHLDGAINIDVQSAEFDALVGKLDRDAEYFVYCRSGNRAASAIDRMSTLGFTSLENGGGLDQAAAATGLEIVG